MPAQRPLESNQQNFRIKKLTDWRDNRKKKEKINELEGKTRNMDKQVDDLNIVIDRHEQYFRGYCILVHGITENENEDSDVVVTDILNGLLQEKLTDIDLDPNRWIGKLDKGEQSRPIMIKFARYNIRHRVF